MARAALEVKNLSFSYPDGTEALRDIDFTVQEGESVGIIGANGSGKSTLLLHTNGVLRNNGSISVFGRELNDGNLSEIRRKVGLVFQNPDDQLFMPIVFDDVAFGPINMNFEKKKVFDLTEKALNTVGMLDHINRSSHHLSFGQKKRVSFATILSMGPDILVLDEPTSNLDPKARRELIDFLKAMNITKLIASHDLEFVFRICQRTILLNGGRKVADGDTKEILSDKDLLEKSNLELPCSIG